MNTPILAQLMAQGVQQGADLATLRAIAEEAGELGASRALARLGLDDKDAAKDMAELRQLLEAWRDAKKSAWRAVVGWVVRIGGALLIAGIAMRMGFAGFTK